MTYSVQALDSRALTCRVTAKAKSGRYRIVTDYLTDPDRPTVILHSRFEALRGQHDGLPRLRPLRPDAQRQRRRRRPSNAGADGGTVARDRRPHAPDRLGPGDGHERRQPRLRAARSTPRSTPTSRFEQVSNGYAGAAERRPQAARRDAHAHGHLHRRRARQPRPDRAGRPRPRRRRSRSRSASARRRPRRIGAAQRHAARAAVADRARSTSRGWHRYDATTSSSRGARTGVSRDDWDALLDEYYLSANYVRAATEDKTFPGAIAAALASPWGQAVAAGDPRQHLLRLLPRGLRARPLRGLDGGVPRRRPRTSRAT